MKTRLLFGMTVVLTLLSLTGCQAMPDSNPSLLDPEVPEISDPPVDEVLLPEEPVRGSSLFCWDTFFFQHASFDSLYDPLRPLDLTRVYQSIPEQSWDPVGLALEVRNFASEGVEVVYLTGSPDWLWTDLTEFQEELDRIDAYNHGIGQKDSIRAVAIDAESHIRPAWKKDPVTHFALYLSRMEEAREIAHARGLRVIQVIPTDYDDIDLDLFRDFLRRCCDEVSLMNYRKSTQLTAISQEVQLCRELGIPVETIFETMPRDRSQGVSPEITYYYDGIEALASAMEEMKETYGPSLGIGYHHFETIYHMLCGGSFVQLYPYSDPKDPLRTKNGQPGTPGLLHLTGEDGSHLTGVPSWPNGFGEGYEYCYFVAGVVPGVRYSVQLESSPYTCNQKWCLTKDVIRSTEAIHFNYSQKNLERGDPT